MPGLKKLKLIATVFIVLTLVLGGMPAYLAFPRPVSAGTDGGLLQFTSAGHVLGFSGDGVIVASARHMLRTDFLDARAVSPEADGEVSGESSAGTVSPLGRVTYRNLWDGVTVVYEASEGAVAKSTYYLDATEEGIPVDLIRLGYNRPVEIDEEGNLLIIYEDGTMVEGAPLAWQETEGGRKPVTVAYDLRGEGEVGFSLGDYAPGIPLVIDPVMTWNTFLGGSGDDYGYAIAVDGDGNVYVGGHSSATWGGAKVVRAHYTGTNDDAFAAKLNSSGTLQWNTFLGDSGTDISYPIAVDSSGNVYVGGYSDATWGTPVRAHYTGTNNDGFAAKLDGSGNLTWNTFLGGSGSGADYGMAIAVDSSANVYVGGYSDATWGSPVRIHTSGDDGFAARLDLNGNFVPPWASYESDYSTPRETYNSSYQTVYMEATDIADVSYLIAYYDDGGAKRGSEATSASSGTLQSSYLLTTDTGAAAGTWHALVQPNSGYTGFGTESYATITASPDTYGLLADDDFYVAESAIPEFPTVIAMLLAMGLSVGVYYWVRKGYHRQVVTA